MEELLASQTKKIILPSRGQQVEGEIISITDQEIVLDIGTKSEGVLPKKELATTDQLKLGDKLKAFVVVVENEHGQVVLSTSYQTKRQPGKGLGRGMDWNKFIQAQNQKNKLQAVVLEVNKGGLIVEVDDARGFLPNSQVGFELLRKAGEGLENLIGQTLSLTVIEVDSNNNKLIFSQRGQVADDVKEKLKAFKNGQTVQGKIVAILPFGLVVDVKGVEGLVFIADVSWEKVDDLSKMYKLGQEVAVLVTGTSEDLGRLNLSVKKLSEDPFSKLAEKFPADEVVKAEVMGVSELGATFKLADNIEGFMSAAKMEPDTSYEVGKSMTVLVDSADVKKRRINLAPFITSTESLIYK